MNSLLKRVASGITRHLAELHLSHCVVFVYCLWENMVWDDSVALRLTLNRVYKIILQPIYTVYSSIYLHTYYLLHHDFTALPQLKILSVRPVSYWWHFSSWCLYKELSISLNICATIWNNLWKPDSLTPTSIPVLWFIFALRDTLCKWQQQSPSIYRVNALC